MADVSTPAGARDWAASWLHGDGTPWWNREMGLRKIARAASELRRDWPEAARELRVILLAAELGYL